jgi:hypothetical protein
MDQYDLGRNRMPIGLRFAFFRFHVRNACVTWYYNRRNKIREARMSKQRWDGRSQAPRVRGMI